MRKWLAIIRTKLGKVLVLVSIGVLIPQWEALSGIPVVWIVLIFGVSLMVCDYIKGKRKGNLLDKPWTTATLGQYPITSRSLSIVQEVWKSRIVKGEQFTIREA